MVKIQYGGRHSTNLIDDVISPAVLNMAAEDRTGLNNFRPFEELGRNLRQAYANPGNNVMNITILQVSTATPINVNWIHSELANFTYIPPVSSFASIGYAQDSSALNESLINYFDNIGHGFNKMLSKAALPLSVYVISPILALISKSKALLFGQQYKLGQPTKSFTGITLPTFIRTSLVVAAIGVSSILLIRGISDPGALPGTASESSGTTTIKNGSNLKPGSAPSTTPFTSNPSASRNSGSAESNNSLNPGSTWDVTSPASNNASAGSSFQSAEPVERPIGGDGSRTSPIEPSPEPITEPNPSTPLPLPIIPIIEPQDIVPQNLVPTEPVLINDPILSQPILP